MAGFTTYVLKNIPGICIDFLFLVEPEIDLLLDMDCLLELRPYQESVS
jgi:hypothetical protein